ncbi:MAG: hypothetical protein ACK557_21075, partial [Planctomycetota bacterium]
MLKTISLQELATAIPPAIAPDTLAGARAILEQIEQRGEAALREAIARYEPRPGDARLGDRPLDVVDAAG